MAAEGDPLPAHAVGMAFVKKYYKFFTRSPQRLFRFYKEKSKISWMDNQGGMISATGLDAINEMLLSVDYSDYSVDVEINEVDAQESLGGCVAVLVSGYLKKKFAQSFHLVPQEKGYYVLNDIFRLVPEANHQPSSSASTSGDSEPLTPEQAEQLEQQDNEVPEEEKLDEVETIDPSAEISCSVKEEVQAGKEIDEVSKSLQVSPSDIKYIGILPTPTSLLPTPTSLLPTPTSLPAFGTENASVSPGAAYSYTSPEPESFGYSIHIKNLPLDVTPAQLQEEFMKFGPIKPGGIQIRYFKQGRGRCFGFVHFEVADAVARAIEASPVIIGGLPTLVEKTRSTDSGARNRGRHRNQSTRGRRNSSARRVFDKGEGSSRTGFGHGGGSKSG